MYLFNFLQKNLTFVVLLCSVCFLVGIHRFTPRNNKTNKATPGSASPRAPGLAKDPEAQAARSLRLGNHEKPSHGNLAQKDDPQKPFLVAGSRFSMVFDVFPKGFLMFFGVLAPLPIGSNKDTTYSR